MKKTNKIIALVGLFGAIFLASSFKIEKQSLESHENYELKVTENEVVSPDKDYLFTRYIIQIESPNGSFIAIGR